MLLTMKYLKRIVVGLLVLALVLALATWLVFQMPSFGGVAEGARLARMQASPQWHNGRFENTPPYVSDMSLQRELHDWMG